MVYQRWFSAKNIQKKNKHFSMWVLFLCSFHFIGKYLIFLRLLLDSGNGKCTIKIICINIMCVCVLVNYVWYVCMYKNKNTEWARLVINYLKKKKKTCLFIFIQIIIIRLVR